MDPDRDVEEFESIPWSHLVSRPASTNRVITAVGAVAVLLAVLFVGLRVFAGGARQVTVTVPVPMASTLPPVAPEPGPATTPTPDRAYSEADLMAVIPEEDQRTAAARAEWFVTDYFTVDGDVAAAVPIEAALPSDLAPDLPHADTGGVSYVEWAAAARVEPAEPGHYRVVVLYRTLAGRPGEALSRLPVRAVAVTVAVEGEYGTAVVDLPEPVAVESADVAFVEPPSSELPPEVAALVLQAATLAGSEPRIVGAGLDASGWRVLVTVTDNSGLRWPLVVRP